MDLRDVLAQGLHQLGTRVLFGVIGEGNLYVVDSFRNLDGARYVGAAHEAGAVLMANGYAQISGEVGVATVTHGPGLTNAITALVESARNRSPLVVVAGEVSEEDWGNAQSLDQRKMLSGSGAAYVQVSSAESALADLVSAWQQARHERRPVVLGLSASLQWKPAPHFAVAPADRADPDPMPCEKALDEALGMLATARRPLILAGAGAASSAAQEALVALAEARGAKLATTLRAKDLFRGHPAAVGICGGYATPEGGELISSSDCVVAFGASLNEYTTLKGELVDGASVIQVDTAAANLGRHLPVRVALHGDATATARAMTAALVDGEIAPSGFQAVQPSRALTVQRPTVPAGSLDGEQLMAIVEASVPRERTLVTDAGRFLYLAYRCLSNPPVSGYVHSIGFGVIGVGLAHAIGAWFAAPQRPVLHVTGDGGFMLGGLAELHTAVREGVDLIVLVVNDGAYGAEHIQLRRRNHPVDVSTMTWPDFASVAQSLGAPGLTVRTPDDLSLVPDFLAQRRGPVLLDAILDPDHLNVLAG